LHVILFVLDQSYLIEKLIDDTILGMKHIAEVLKFIINLFDAIGLNLSEVSLLSLQSVF
jgi:hypothetical protein